MAPNFLQQYDMSLAVSEQAINAQLEHLYKTPLPGQLINANPRKTLIDHHLLLVDKTGPSKLAGEILPPKVSFTGLSAVANAHRTVKLSFTFTKDAKNKFTWYETQFDEDGIPTAPKPVDTPIAGWTFSFEAAIGRADIQEVLEHAVHPDIKNELSEYVNSEDYLVSSLFCLFNSVQIANTFSLVNEESQAQNSDSLVGHFLANITTHFNIINKDPVKAGNTPYVLGYAISQKPKREVGKALFAPAKFHMTTVPEGSRPTLNWNMLLNHNSTVDPEKDPTAGIFAKSFFTTVHSDKDDGILAMSSDMIVQKLLRDKLAPDFQPADLMSGWDAGFGLWGDLKQIEPSSTTLDKNSFCRQKTWETDYASTAVGSDWFGIWVHSMFSGDWTERIWYSSLNEDHPEEAAKPDSKRRLYLNVDVDIHQHWTLKTSLYGLAKDDWSKAMETDIRIPIKLRYNVTCDAEGKWAFEKDDARSEVPERDADGRLKIHTFSEGLPDMLKSVFGHDPFANDGVPMTGVPVTVEAKGILGILGFFGAGDFLGWNDMLGRIISIFAESTTFDWKADLLGDIRTKILMPAGNVFTFSDLDTDSDGHVYSHCNYKTISGGDRIDKPDTGVPSKA